MSEGYFSYKGLDYPYIILEHDGKGYLFATNELKQAILDNGTDAEGQMITQQVYQYVEPDIFNLPIEVLESLYFTDWIV